MGVKSLVQGNNTMFQASARTPPATSFIKNTDLLRVSLTFFKMQVSILILSSQDFKKTTKLTWIAESTKAPLLPTIAVQFDDVISKPVLTKNDDFKDYINKDSKVRPEADGRINIILEFNTFCHNLFFNLTFQLLNLSNTLRAMFGVPNKFCES